MKTLAVVIALSLSGCAMFQPGGTQSAGPGQAVYHYNKSADGACEVVITSARDFPAGIEAAVGENCEVNVTADVVTGQTLQLQLMQLFEQLLPLLQASRGVQAQ